MLNRPVNVPPASGIPVCSGAEEMVGLGFIFRHGLEADRVPRLGRGTKVAEIWAAGTEFRELDIWWQTTWYPLLEGTFNF